MINKLRILLRYLNYRLKAKTKHAVHSPFVFDFICNVLEDKNVYPQYKNVEQQVIRLKRNPNSIETVDFGSRRGRTGYTTRLRKVKEIAATTGISRKYGRLLFRIVKYFNPEYILELGTSTGISTMYQAIAAPSAVFKTIEGCASTAALAQESLHAAGCSNVSLAMGNFDKVLPETLGSLRRVDHAFIDGNHTYEATVNYFGEIASKAGNDTLLIFHDIHWSAEMEKAWEEIIKHPRVTVTIDLFNMGLVFFRRGLSRQHFIIRY
jgi:predicted O-methyltransferase YrrM